MFFFFLHLNFTRSFFFFFFKLLLDHTSISFICNPAYSLPGCFRMKQNETGSALKRKQQTHLLTLKTVIISKSHSA